MSSEIVPIPPRDLARAGLENLPAAIGRAGEAAAWRFIEFFAATIRNRNTRAAYAHAVSKFFSWCEKHRVYTLEQVKPVVIASYIENHPDLPGDFCTSRIETGRQKGTWEHAEEDVHAGADCAEAAAD